MPAEPSFTNHKLEFPVVRRCIVFPADGAETRIVYMVDRPVIAGDILALCTYNRCVDMASTFGDEYRKMAVTEHKISRDGDESTYFFYHNLSPKLPVNLNVARVIGVTPSHLKTRKRLFWRGDVVAMKVQPESEEDPFIVESLDADPFDLKPLEGFFRERYQEGRLEYLLKRQERSWVFLYAEHYSSPSSLLPLSHMGATVAKGEQYLYNLNELRCVIGLPPLPRPTYMKSYTELAFTLYNAFKSALHLHQKVTGPPKLPLDLERRIFEICALESPELCTTLVLVARWVHVWIDPILIESVSMMGVGGSERRHRLKLFLAKLTNGKPVEYYTKHIKNLSILDTSQNTETDDILAICTGVENLALWAHVDFFGNPHSGRNLRRLTIKLGRCFLSAPHFHHPCFANLTHLHLYDDDEAWSTYPGWETLSSLTHLAFACAGSPETIMQLMQTLPAVQYVALGSYRWTEAGKYTDAAVDNCPHFGAIWGDRVVRLSWLPHHDWERGARGQGDFWELVEQEVERRLEGRSVN